MKALPDAVRKGDAIAIPGDYQHRARTNGFVVQRFWHAEKERMIARLSPPSAGDRVLDIGCGSGVIADFLASSGAIVTGIDASPAAIEYARKTFVRPNLDFFLGLIEEIDLPPETIDRIYCMELIEHIFPQQARDLFTRVHRLSKPGASLVITTPNYSGTWPVVEKILDSLKLVPHLAGDQHVTQFNRQSLTDALEDTGWKVEKLTTFSTVAPFVSVLGWGLATRVAELEDAADLHFGNILFAVARKAQ